MKNTLIKATLVLALFSGSLHVAAAPAKKSYDAQFSALTEQSNSLMMQGRVPEAAALYEPLAKKGHVKSQANAGVLYFMGQQNRKAFYWLQKAANKGETTAQTTLGDMYRTGVKGAEGVYPQKDVAKARYWYQKAAKQGFKPAIEKLETLGN